MAKILNRGWVKGQLAIECASQNIKGAMGDRNRTNEPKLSDEHRVSVLMEAHCIFYLGRLEETRSKLNEAKAYYIDAMQIFQVEGK